MKCVQDLNGTIDDDFVSLCIIVVIIHIHCNIHVVVHHVHVHGGRRGRIGTEIGIGECDA